MNKILHFSTVQQNFFWIETSCRQSVAAFFFYDFEATATFYVEKSGQDQMNGLNKFIQTLKLTNFLNSTKLGIIAFVRCDKTRS